jgi:hypothetical protein
MSNPIPDTCIKLRSILLGESRVYYRGDFGADIARSLKPPFVAANYAEVLRRVKLCADTMQADGRVRLTQRAIQLEADGKKPPVEITEYIALGT